MIHCIYLHGFASGPSSTKAQYFKSKLLASGFNVHVPDLNGDSFCELTLSSQLDIIRGVLQSIPDSHDLFMVGSSMGGLLSTLTANECSRIRSLILLAPGFGLNKRWHELLGPQKLHEWKRDGSIPIFNYVVNKELPLKYSFIEDAERYQTDQLKVGIPTLVIHGVHDTVVPQLESEQFAENNPHQVELHLLDDDHGLIKTLPQIWEISKLFIERQFATRLER